MKIDKRLKERGKLFRSVPVSDCNQIIAFEKIIKNYIKMQELLKNKQHHSPLITGRKAGARIQVKLILSDSIIAEYIDEENGDIQCMKHEFHKIFCKNKNLIYK